MADQLDTVEMRGDVRRVDYDVFDAVCKARSITKQALLARIVREWAAKEVHVSNVVQRMTRGKGSDSFSDWDESGS
jgi:hypothetical protein